MDNVYFTADLHFGHRGVIEFCNRPFTDIDHMDDTLISNWNARVDKGDRVYILGDFSYDLKVGRAVEILRQLEGQKFLIAGNHDASIKNKQAFKDQFVWVKDLYGLKVNDTEAKTAHPTEAKKRRQYIALCHYPLATWNLMSHGSWHLHGHSHGGLSHDPIYPANNRLDVGVDALSRYCDIEYAPISYDEVKAALVRQYVVRN